MSTIYTTHNPDQRLPLSGVCFDLDGTLWDSQPAHYQSLVFSCVSLTYEPPTWEVFAERSIRQGGKIWDVLEHDHGLSSELVSRIRRLKDDAFVNQFAPEIHLNNGVDKLLDSLRKADIRIALATSARTATIDCFLKHAWSGPLPDVVVGHDDVSKTKPDPLIYQTAAKRLGINPANLLAIEDSPAGIESAQRAGMRCIGLVTEVFDELDLAQADAVIDSFTAITVCDQA